MGVLTHRRLLGMVRHTVVVHPLAVRRLAVLPSEVHPSEVLHMGVLLMGIRPMVQRRIRIPDYLRPVKNARISSASSFGSSIAAK